MTILQPETRQNLPPCGDDLEALASERVYHNDTYNLTVYENSQISYMETFFFDEGMYAVDTALSYIFLYLQLSHDYNPLKQRAYVFEPLPILEWNTRQPERGKHYIIVDLSDAPRNDMLFCKRSQLAPGDVVVKATGVTKVTVNHPWLNPINEQGYYRFWLIGGEKYERFQHEPESVATWRESCRRWHWKGM